VCDRLLVLHDQLNEHLRQSIASIRQVMRQPRWAKPAALLRTMPGVGEITALTVLAELGDVSRFKSRAAVANYAGLTPIVRSSNQKTWQGGISHRGSSHLRRVLVEAAWTAVPRVPHYHHQYQRIKARRGSQTAIVAVARQILEDLFTMLRKDQAFRFVDPPRSCGGEARSDGSVAVSVAG
jgi:transposase